MTDAKPYQTQTVRSRNTRPLHSRAAILANAEAVFKGNVHDEKKREASLIHWPIPSAGNVAQWPNVNNASNITDEKKSQLTQLLNGEDSNAGK